MKHRVLFAFLVMITAGTLFVARPAQANFFSQIMTRYSGAVGEASCHASPGPPCVSGSIKEAAAVSQEEIVEPAWKIALVQGLLDLAQFVTNRLAYESALLVANGGVAQGSLFYEKSAAEGFREFGLDVAGEAVAELSEGLNSTLGTKFDVCLSPDSLINLNLAIGIAQKYQPEAPRCDILEFISNWESFAVDAYNTVTDPDQAQHAIISKFAESLQPGRNELSAAIQISQKISEAVGVEKDLEVKMRTSQDLRDVVNKVTGATETPHKAVEDDFFSRLNQVVTGEETKISAKDVLDADASELTGLAWTAASTFTNTLLSTLFNRVYKGLFPSDGTSQDPFNIESIAQSKPATEALSSVFATIPFATTQYNALSEFVVCPPQGISNRGVNNCVMDSQLFSAVTRGSNGAPITVQEAIDEGLVNGGWPLIPSSNQSANQDPFCYTYGFCHSNLVKLRKARVIPIGWELAAERNSPSNPKTLQQIIDEFNNCNAQGTLDAEHPYCHLIDPNWVLKYPETQCRAIANSDVPLTGMSPGRQSYCADSQSCLGENSKGQCTDGFGYCVKEKNVWRFRGDECPSQYAGCLAFTSTTDQSKLNAIINTVDVSVCGQANAGCQWYRTIKEIENGKVDWLKAAETYNTAARDANWKYVKTDGTIATPIAAVGTTGYAYQQRLYLTRAAQSCAASDAGCSELLPAEGAIVNTLRNPSFETDENKDGVPDGWMLEGLTTAQYELATTTALYGARSLKAKAGTTGSLSQDVTIRPNQFYSLSIYGKKNSTAGGAQASLTVSVEVLDNTGKVVPLTGLGQYASGTAQNVACTVQSNVIKLGGTIGYATSSTPEWQRAVCSFSAPASATHVRIKVQPNQNSYLDAIQLEPTETPSAFTSGLKQGVQAQTAIKVAPSYLNCTGAPTDPAECAGFAQMCQAQDVGCNLYTPEDGDPALPAIASALDQCPNECVGYAAFKQEATKYEAAQSQVYFIPTSATACTQEEVGCDSFTNLSFATEGGENVEYYTNLRACATEQMANGGAGSNNQKAVFYTWEGSDKAGYQLRSWNLLESNLGDTSSVTYANGQADTTAGKAPCIKWDVTSTDQLVCVDNTANFVNASGACHKHDDILSNPDCREFFDAAGNVHYREFSRTITVSDQCQPYRKDKSTVTDCDVSGGFWEPTTGVCRYFGLKSESKECAATANGCRSYTGGAGRNSVTILGETFESGSYDGYQAYGSAGVPLISNESLATNGHSVRLVTGLSAGGIATKLEFLKVGGVVTTYDPAVPATCPSSNTITPAGCQIAPDCIVEAGKNSCGTLSNKLVKGKMYTLEFWAKGSGTLKAGFEVSYVQGVGGGSAVQDKIEFSGPAIVLDGTWKKYELGPLDTSTISGLDIGNFQKYSSLYFSTATNQTFYLDNIVLKQAEENITIVKDSWVIPSTCDTAPNGTPSPQYYLGCEAYTDQNSNRETLYQFTNLCSESVVGCEKFYKTQQTAESTAQVFNALCVNGTPQGSYVDVSEPEIGNKAVGCTVKGTTYCTIPAGSSSCTFNYNGLFPDALPFDNSNGFAVVYGPETEVVPADAPVYLVNNGKANCSASSAGCTEVGKPKFSQDQSKVEGFESAYFINDPDQYKDALCSHEALFCEEYASTKDGNFYFKQPLEKLCEYRASVSKNGKAWSGWFKKGSDEPCDPSYVIAGDQAAIRFNGDKDYKGWIGTCEQQYDLCTEFLDVVDTEAGFKKDGTSYYFINNDRLTELNTVSAEPCDGKVSQKEGCALFNNRSNSSVLYNASASYVVSTHADVFLQKSVNDLVDPVSCAGGGGKYTVNGKIVDVCQQRCQYTVPSGDELSTSMSVQSSKSSTDATYFERSCYVNSDCPTLRTKLNEEVIGTCKTVGTVYRLIDDSNEVLKVTRDRSCSAWLACDSSRTSFNERTNKFEPICDSINLCVRGSVTGQTTNCVKWDERDPQILTDALYSSRDVTWSGYELSGLAIPNQLPVELYDQFNVNPLRACVDEKSGEHELDANGYPKACTEDSECLDSGVCEPLDPDYRLVFNAGSCDAAAGNGGSCTIGYCAKSGKSCATPTDCGSGDSCAIGVCQASQAPGASGSCPTGYSLENGKCVDQPLSKAPLCVMGSSCGAGKTCVPTTRVMTGACFNDRCVTDIWDTSGDGKADKLDTQSALLQECRGYPEVDSPYDAAKVVTQWITPKPNNINGEKQKGFDVPSPDAQNIFSKPYTYAVGYKDARTCAGGTLSGAKDVNCECSYDKVAYGKGVNTLYVEPQSPSSSVPSGLCNGGPYEGQACVSDADCSDYSDTTKPDAGTCMKRTAQDTFYGWTGYCIERDSAITQYATTPAEKQACLTWLPVDQLSGATDLFGKYTSAGFVPDDSYYCAEVDVAYDIGYDGYHCAEGVNFTCDDEFNYGEEKPWEDVQCPKGFDVYMTGCGDAAPGSTCTNDWESDDWPYFCIPKNSFKTDDDQGQIGDACDPPNSGNGFIKNVKENNYNIIFLSEDTWKSYETKYDDCQVKGVFKDDDVWDVLFKGEQPKEASVVGYPVCKSVVQVNQAQQQNEDRYNAAYTDRLWQAREYTIQATPSSVMEKIGYQYLSALAPFGKGVPLIQKEAEKDMVPYQIQMCQVGPGKAVLPNAITGECTESDAQLRFVSEARSYVPFEFYDGSASIIPSCSSPNCSCDSAADCNQGSTGTTISCVPKTCSDGKTSCGTPSQQKACKDAGYVCEAVCSDDASQSCTKDADCWENTCNLVSFLGIGYCRSSTTASILTINPAITAKERVRQLFATSYQLHVFKTSKTDNFPSEWSPTDEGSFIWDEREQGDDTYDPSAPTIWSLGDCVGTQCKEGKEGKFTVNDRDTGDIEGVVSKSVTVSFFLAAESDQMPVRNIVVDWGDGEGTDPALWPTDHQSGSPDDRNYYKNYRGLKPDGKTTYCSSGAGEFGLTPEACSSSYVVFDNHYTCSPTRVQELTVCDRNKDDGRLLNSPCTENGACVYQPRVHVKDNWGWCTGFCNASGNNGCFEGKTVNECDIRNCPGTLAEGCPVGANNEKIVNPWINYDGVVIVKPE